MVLKQTFINHITSLWFTIITTFLIVMGWWYFDFNSDYLFILGSFHLVFTIPVLYLHIEYSVKNAGEEIEISNNEVIIRKHRQKHKFSKDDLAKIIVYKSASLDRGGIPLSAMECYHYTRLITTNGEEIIITCLMSRKLEEEVKKLSGVPYERKKSFFCTSKWK